MAEKQTATILKAEKKQPVVLKWKLQSLYDITQHIMRSEACQELVASRTFYTCALCDHKTVPDLSPLAQSNVNDPFSFAV